MKYILGIDIGTTAIKGAVIGEDGKIYGTQTSEYSLTTLSTGEVEADLQLYKMPLRSLSKVPLQMLGWIQTKSPVSDSPLLQKHVSFWMKEMSRFVR